MSATPHPFARLNAGYLVALMVVAAPTPRPTPHPTTTPAPRTQPADVVSNLSGGTIMFLIAAVALIGYAVSVRIHPNRPCRTCSGKGFHRGSVFKYGTRACSGCNGRGVLPRFGTRFFAKNP